MRISTGNTQGEDRDHLAVIAADGLSATLADSAAGGSILTVSAAPLQATSASISELVAGIMMPVTITASISYPVFVAPFACSIAAVDIAVNGTGFAANDTNYWTVNIRKFHAGAAVGTMAAKSTQVTPPGGGVPSEAVATFSDWNFDAATFDPTHRVLAKGDYVNAQFLLTGSATGINWPVSCIQVRYEPI